jgi:hypothetical protein
MARKDSTPKQAIGMLREAEGLLDLGAELLPASCGSANTHRRCQPLDRRHQRRFSSRRGRRRCVARG